MSVYTNSSGTTAIITADGVTAITATYNSTANTVQATNGILYLIKVQS